MDQTPVTYPIWSQDHEMYINRFRDRGYPENKIAQYRYELETQDVDRVDDFTAYLLIKNRTAVLNE